MTDERESVRGPRPGRPERYPRVNQTDVVERTVEAEDVAEPRSFRPDAEEPPSRESDSECAANERRLGPEGDPAEGKA
jgi:hypothetical protein